MVERDEWMLKALFLSGGKRRLAYKYYIALREGMQE